MNYKFSLKRWLDIAAYAAIGALFFLYSQSSLVKLTRAFETLILVGDLQIILLFAIAGSCLWKVNSLLGIRLPHFKHTLCYPSLIVAIPLSLLIAYFLPTANDEGEIFADKSALLLFGSIAFCIILSVIQLLVSTTRKQKTSASNNLAESSPSSKIDFLASLSDDQICSWIAREDPIETLSQDCFAFSERVERIVSALKHSSSQTVALVGGYGCGKSSLVNLIEEGAGTTAGPKLLFCKVSCWGFDDSSAAQETILSHAIDRLSEEIDCFRLRGLPARYVNALSKTSGILDASFQAIEERSDPLSTLEEFTPLLSSIQARLVVVIEDVDRNGVKFDVSHIQALLERFRHVDGLSFIICAGQDAEIAFSKLCEHIETIPDLEETDILAVTERVLEMCQKKYPDDVDPLPDRKKPTDQSQKLLSLWMSTYTPWQIAVARLMRTPRLLKRTLLRFTLAWDKLHGEIDIDELLIVSCLRICSPQTFQFFCQRNTVLGRLSQQTSGRTEQDDKTEQTGRIKTVWDSVDFESDIDRHSAAALVQRLFPSSEPVFKERSYSHSESPQTIAAGGPNSHFERLVSESIRASDVRDQKVLKLIFQANSNENAIAVLAKSIAESDQCASVFEHFSKLLRNERLLALTSHVYAAVRQKHGSKADRDSAGFCEFWRIVQRRMRWTPEYAEWPTSEIAPCVPKHLKMIVDVYYFWLSQEKRLSQKKFRKMLVRTCQKMFQRITSQEFVDGFDPEHPYTLFHLVYTSEYEQRPPPPFTGARFWKWLAPLLVNAARIEPSKMIPQIAILLEAKTQGGRDPSRPIDFVFDTQFVRELFGNLEHDILVELSKPLDFPWNYDRRLKETLALVPERSKQLLTTLTAPPASSQT